MSIVIKIFSKKDMDHINDLTRKDKLLNEYIKTLLRVISITNEAVFSVKKKINKQHDVIVAAKLFKDKTSTSNRRALRKALEAYEDEEGKKQERDSSSN